MLVRYSIAWFVVAGCVVPIWSAEPDLTHTDRTVEGWTVRVDDRLLSGPDGALGTKVRNCWFRGSFRALRLAPHLHEQRVHPVAVERDAAEVAVAGVVAGVGAVEQRL